jgi:hypothetical protein
MATFKIAATDRYSTIQDEWETKEGGSFVSPLVEERPSQAVIFGEGIRNGSISADVIIIDSRSGQHQHDAMEASLIARYGGPDGYYYAGTGAFGARFFIGKTIPGPIWLARRSVGLVSSVFRDKTYRLRLEFTGSQITLFENDVRQLTVVDDSYQIGQCGLATCQTRARFENVRIEKAKPKAFVIMPFASELNFVYRVIKETVKGYDIDCVRADEIAVSRPIMDDVKTQIAEADLVIVDFTGKNTNVYYEAGLADAWRKNWIVLSQSSEDMTFDVHDIRSIRYANAMGADKKLAEDLSNALEALGYTRSAQEQDVNKG